MRILLAVAAAIAAVALSSPALAAEAASQQPDPNEMICKRIAPEAGTRIGARRMCLTRREWEERARDDRAMTEESQRRDSRGVSP